MTLVNLITPVAYIQNLEAGLSIGTVTVTLIIISFSSFTLSFIPNLKPSFSANPSHCSLSFSSGLTCFRAVD